MLPTRANLQPAFGIYLRDEATGLFRAYGVLVFTLSGDASLGDHALRQQRAPGLRAAQDAARALRVKG